MSNEVQLAYLLDPQGHRISEWHPGFEARKREIQFQTGYNPDTSRRGSSGGLYQNAGSETWAKSRDRKTASYDAVSQVNNGWIGGVLARFVLYSCGRLHPKSECGDESVASIYEDYFCNWCGDEPAEDETMRCDLSGRHRFLKMVQMGALGYLVRGDHGYIEVAPEFSPTGEFCLQSVSGDRIGNPFQVIQEEGLIDGIRFDPNTGRIAHYEIWQRTRLNQYINKREVPGDSFIHIFDPDWDDEYRGRSKLTRGLNHNRDIGEWIEFEKAAMKIQSQYAVGITTKDPFNNNGPSAWTGKNPDGTPTMDAIWGRVTKYGEGESINMMAPSARPNGATMGFMETLVRMIAISLKLSYGFVWNLATLGGAPQRIEVEGDLRTIQEFQQNVLVARLLNRVWRKVIAQGIASGALPPIQGWRKVDWNFGPYITSDLGYAMEADIAAVSHGIIKVEQVTGKYGHTAKDVFSSNADTFNTAIKIGSEKGVPVEVTAAGLYPSGTAQRAAFIQSQLPPPPPPPPLSPTTIGEKALKDVLDLQIAVGDGKIDRESAVNTLVYKYDVPRAIAEKVIPDEPDEADLNRAAGLDAKGNHAPVAGPKTSSSRNGSNGSSKSKVTSRN